MSTYLVLCRGEEDDYPVQVGTDDSLEGAFEVACQSFSDFLTEMDVPDRKQVELCDQLRSKLKRGGYSDARHATVQFRGVAGMSNNPSHYSILRLR